jgi:hypothetical protein
MDLSEKFGVQLERKGLAHVSIYFGLLFVGLSFCLLMVCGLVAEILMQSETGVWIVLLFSPIVFLVWIYCVVFFIRAIICGGKGRHFDMSLGPIHLVQAAFLAMVLYQVLIADHVNGRLWSVMMVTIEVWCVVFFAIFLVLAFGLRKRIPIHTFVLSFGSVIWACISLWKII